MTQHHFIGPYCHGCGLFTSELGKPGSEDCETVIAIALAQKESVLEKVRTFCAAHPDGLYWVRYDGRLDAGRLCASSAPRVWIVLGADESDNYSGIGLDDVEIIAGPIPPPEGMVYE